MLTHLRVKNIALIDDISLDLDEGLNILTGETGAGKSIIMGAVNLALGARVSKDLLGNPERPAQVDLLFDVTDTRARKHLVQMGLLEEGSTEVLLSRRITPNGRAVNRINEDVATAAALQKAAGVLIDVHGQHEHQSLLDASRHIDLLDRFDERTQPHKEALRGFLDAYKEKEQEYQRWKEQSQDKERILALMEYEAQEIDEAGLREGEEDELGERIRLLRSAQRIQESCGNAVSFLRGGQDGYGGGIGALNDALAQMQWIEELDPKTLSSIVSALSDAVAIAEDAASEIARYGEDTQSDPQALEEAQDRLEEIRRLKGKYGDSLEKILAYRESLTESMEKIQHIQETLSACERELAVLEQKMKRESEALSVLRRQAAQAVSREITAILTTLQFQDPEFAVQITPRDHITAKGQDQVQFMIRTNVGEKLRPLDKIASGGEISRIMLAIKTVLAQRDEIPTLIFDEIDTGISGRTAQSVAEKLALISEFHQIICITHLPQIAAMADHHLRIEKTVREGRARTEVAELSESESTEELARMLGGTQMTEAVLQNASELKKMASDWKEHNSDRMRENRQRNPHEKE